MNEMLASLTDLPGVNLAAVVSRDGRVETASRDDAANDTLASLAAVIFGAIGSALAKGGIAPLDACLLEAGNTAVQLQGAGERVIVVVASKDANAGRIKLALRRAAERASA
jgi:predicted regulator of Ras-like GTPase activity (Roadblock/LC7/MglB family)